jgi:predicted O-methyltransferase YrrM
VNRAETIAIVRFALAAAAAVFGVSLAVYALAPRMAPLAAAGAAVLVILVELGRVRAMLSRRMDELTAEVAQAEPLITLQARLPTRRPLPPMRGYAIAPDFAVLLAMLVADEKPRLVVETGSGVSTLVIAYALERLGGGRVVALDHDEQFAAETRAEIDRHGLTAYATVVHAPLEPVEVDGERHRWYAVSALDRHAPGEIDLVVDDGPPKYVGAMLRAASLPVFSQRLSARGFFVLDYVGDEERVMLERWRTRYPHFVQEHLDTKKGNVILRRARA